MTRMSVEEFERRLERLPMLFPGDQSEALEDCDAMLMYGVEENFLNMQTSAGRSWPQRKDPRAHHPLLQDTGDLYRAAAGRDSSGSQRTIADNVLTRRMVKGTPGTSRAGIRRHEFGDEEVLGREGILARPYYGVSKSTADKCADVVADRLVEAVMEAFA